MALASATLSAQLAALPLTMSQPTANNGLANAWETYFSSALAGPIPIVPGTLSGAKAAFLGALSSLDPDTGNAAAVLTAAITAFWGVVAGSAATIFLAVPPATSATPPPGLAGLSAALSAVFTANASGGLAASPACDAIAAAIHGTQSGGIVVFPPPLSGGIGPQPIT